MGTLIAETVLLITTTKGLPITTVTTHHYRSCQATSAHLARGEGLEGPTQEVEVGQRQEEGTDRDEPRGGVAVGREVWRQVQDDKHGKHGQYSRVSAVSVVVW